MNIDKKTQTEIEAATFRKLLQHLDNHKEVQNIDLMITADFCRNCLSKWFVSEAEKLNTEVSIEDAHQIVYKMPYIEYKEKFQTPATVEQLKAFNSKKK
ncbi:DUF1244 domain-containing protein [Marinicellulosiphila megalodicopiae]|uniref:DUF1244 domain-containing protein n=1 Tax=Marinicellulosiphila megalodicopiae TaxID=2724896 RepID=UPI003BB070A8